MACVYTEPRRTKRKRTDVRVRELEREVRMLSELLHLRLRTEQASSDQAARSMEADGRSTPPPQSRPEGRTADPVAAGILSMGMAERLFKQYVTNMAPQRPFVVFRGVTPFADGDEMPSDAAVAAMAGRVREKMPVLFLAILAVAMGTGVEGDAGSEGERMGMALDALLLRTYADRIFVEGQKSLELVQALIVSSSWGFTYFDTPDSLSAPGGASPGNGEIGPTGLRGFDHLRFYQHLHMAATMALELESPRGGHDAAGSEFTTDHLADPLVFERTLLVCYLSCSRYDDPCCCSLWHASLFRALFLTPQCLTRLPPPGYAHVHPPNGRVSGESRDIATRPPNRPRPGCLGAAAADRGHGRRGSRRARLD